eukprot:GHVT01074056.1.p1 GENE.GHVT01074056.1~~GHVT01074056.1.p1  ORF type:complete len:546 (-),score=29.58 GHVT01074056.1:460-2097(-)
MHARLHKLADEFNKESKLFKIWLKSTKAKPKTISFSMCDPNEFSKKLYSTATIPVVGLIKWLPNITATSFQTEKEFGNHLNTVIALSSVHSKKFDWMVHRCKDIFTYYIIKDGRVERVPSHYVDYFKECKSFLSHIGITKKWLFSYKTGVQHDYAQGLDPNKPGVYEIPPSFVPVNLLIDNQLRFISEVEKPAKFNSADSKFAREVLRLLKKLYPPIEEKQQVPVELETHFVYDIHKTCWFVRLSHMLWRDNGDDESCIDLSENCVAKLLESNDKSNCLRDFIETANVQSEHYAVYPNWPEKLFLPYNRHTGEVVGEGLKMSELSKPDLQKLLEFLDHGILFEDWKEMRMRNEEILKTLSWNAYAYPYPSVFREGEEYRIFERTENGPSLTAPEKDELPFNDIKEYLEEFDEATKNSPETDPHTPPLVVQRFLSNMLSFTLGGRGPVFLLADSLKYHAGSDEGSFLVPLLKATASKDPNEPTFLDLFYTPTFSRGLEDPVCGLVDAKEIQFKKQTYGEYLKAKDTKPFPPIHMNEARLSTAVPTA